MLMRAAVFLLVSSPILMLLVFLLEALPGAPLRHIEIDADGVTS